MRRKLLRASDREATQQLSESSTAEELAGMFVGANSTRCGLSDPTLPFRWLALILFDFAGHPAKHLRRLRRAKLKGHVLSATA